MNKKVTENEQWETCLIEARVMPGSRLNPQHNNGQSLYWFRFVALADNGKKPYIAGRSDRASFPFSGNGQSQTTPTPLESMHGNTLDPLLYQLRREGWEPVQTNKQRWWEYRFKRKTRPQLGYWHKLSRMFSD